uniref:Lon1 n=1 Tax=Arundo donax TaxID=35708 RepID=A0A0A9CQ69_ARUDO
MAGPASSAPSAAAAPRCRGTRAAPGATASVTGARPVAAGSAQPHDEVGRRRRCGGFSA